MKSDQREVAYLMGWDDKVTPEDMPEPGTGVMKVLDEPARPLQVYRMTPSEISRVVVATADYRPELDELSRIAAGEAYERRWEGCEHLFDGSVRPQPVAVAERGPEPEPEPVQRVREGWTDPTADWDTPGAASTPAEPIPTGDDAIADADAALRRIHEQIDDATTRDPDLEAQARAIFEAGGFGYTPPDLGAAIADVQAGEREDPRKAIVFEIVLKSGPNGIGPEAIRDAIARLHPHLEVPHAATIGRWLGSDPRVHRPSYGRYAVRPSKGDTPS